MSRTSTSPTSTWRCPTTRLISMRALATRQNRPRRRGKPPCAGTRPGPTTSPRGASPRCEQSPHDPETRMAVAVTDVPRAIAAATAAASALGLAVDKAVVLHASNRVALRLLPCDVVARVAIADHGAARFEVDLASRLADAS